MPIFSSLLLDPTGLASTLASGVVEKPQEVDESFPLARQVCGVPGVSAGVSAAISNDSSRTVITAGYSVSISARASIAWLSSVASAHLVGSNMCVQVFVRLREPLFFWASVWTIVAQCSLSSYNRLTVSS